MSRYGGHRRRDDGLWLHQRHAVMRCGATYRVKCRQEDCDLEEQVSIVPLRSVRIEVLTHSALMTSAVLPLPSSAAGDCSATFGSTAPSEELASDGIALFSSSGIGSWAVSPRPEPACATATEPMVCDSCFSRADIVMACTLHQVLVFSFYRICGDLSISSGRVDQVKSRRIALFTQSISVAYQLDESADAPPSWQCIEFVK